MRILFLASLAAVAAARRSSTVVPEPPAKRSILQHWGYPYGWGLDNPAMDEEREEDKTMKVKQVKRGESVTSDQCLYAGSEWPTTECSAGYRATYEPETVANHVRFSVVKKEEKMPEKKTGWFGIKRDPNHHIVDDVEEVMDGLE